MPATSAGDVPADPMSQRLLDGSQASGTNITADDIRRSRRAYYANVSFIDSQIGALIQALKDSHALDDTVIIVTSDHGDMLGERGMWYKMSFFEHSARVPLVMAGPGVVQGVVDHACSLVDILPTLLDIASGDRPAIGQPLDGRSLWPLATGGSDEVSEAVGEYCAEMAGHPLFMIRRDHLKYVHCYGDPPQLYDLDADPMERRNLAGDPAYAQIADQFAEEVVARWDSLALRDDVIASQKSRRAVHRGLTAGQPTYWDYTPPRDASQEYVRTHMDWNDVADRSRFPPFDGLS